MARANNSILVKGLEKSLTEYQKKGVAKTAPKKRAKRAPSKPAKGNLSQFTADISTSFREQDELDLIRTMWDVFHPDKNSPTYSKNDIRALHSAIIAKKEEIFAYFAKNENYNDNNVMEKRLKKQFSELKAMAR